MENLSTKTLDDNQGELMSIIGDLNKKSRVDGKDVGVIVAYSGMAKIFQTPN